MNRTSTAILAGAWLMIHTGASAETTQTIGAGSAVVSIDRAATFDPLIVNGTPLSDYTEDRLVIATEGDSWVGDGYPTVFDPFHGANDTDHAFYFPYGGSPDWVRIHTTDSKPIFGIEFMYGNGWTTGDPYGQYPWGNHDAVVEWQTWANGALVSSGLIGVSPILEMGTIVGFYDPVGIDELWVKCTISNSYPPDYQALALDNLHVQLCPTITISPAALPDGRVGDSYHQVLTGDPTATYQFSVVAGNLPPNLTLTRAGILSGVPATAGTFLFTIQATNPTTQCHGAQDYALNIAGLCALPGDLNGDGTADGDDVPFFVECAMLGSSPGANCACGDLDGNGMTDASDAPLFAAMLVGN